MPNGNVPSVFSTFRTPNNPYFPIHHQKTHQYAKVQPDSIDFPNGHATFPTVPSEVLIFSKAIESFTKSLAEVLETTTQEENETEPTTQTQTQITPESAKTLKQAFETLQSQLQKGIETLPETKQPLPKTLLQAVVQTPVFIEQLKELLGKVTPRRPVIEESEIPIQLTYEAPELEKALLEDLKRNIPNFVKTLQAALKELPPSLPPEIKQALEQYLAAPSLEKALPQPLSQPLEKPQVPVAKETPIEQNVLQPKTLLETKQPLTSLPEKPVLAASKPTLPEPATQIPSRTPLGEVKELEAGFVRQAPNIVVKKPVLEGEEPLVLPEPIKKKPSVTGIPAEPIILEKTENPLLKLPEIALKEILENFYPLLKATLELLQKKDALPPELVKLLKQIPELIEQLEQLLVKQPALLTEAQKKTLITLQRTIPTLFENIEKQSTELPEALFPNVHATLHKLIRKIPLHKVIPLLENEIQSLPELKAPLEEAPISSSKTPEKTEVLESAPLLESPFVEPLVQEGAVEETEQDLEEKPASELEKAHGRHRLEFMEQSERIQNDMLNGAESPKSVPVFTVDQFREQIKQMPPQPEFSTEIPFAFIVPYVPNTPIHSNMEDTKISPHDPRKETPESTEGSGSKKIVQMFSYIPKGETLEGDPSKEHGTKKSILDSYAIGVYLVTNEQYAAFLTEQSKLKKVRLRSRGQVFSKDGTLLCQINTGREESDIEAEPQPDYLSFRATGEKGTYPVVCVTYDGALAFCKAGGFRLPTEAEWEKAASLEMTDKNKVNRKFNFGCSQDEISPALANYNTKVSSSFETLTTPVGFYDGKTTFMKEGVFIQTFDAKSPFGCYDMSGNVWEWTQANDSKHAVTKGGCFASTEEDLKVFAKRRKEQNSLDGFTGFRVALS